MSYVTTCFDDEIVRLLKSGAVGFMPSDTIYGLSCRALDERAVERIHKLKKRDAGKPLIVLIADLEMLDVLSIDKEQARPAMAYWPGALSMEFQTPASPRWLHRGLNHFAIRMPANKDLLNVIQKVGPLVSTSANFQGGEPATSPDKARQLFVEEIDFYVDAGEINNPPSTLAVVEDGRLKVIRQGAVKID